jgi:hypothetical protein
MTVGITHKPPKECLEKLDKKDTFLGGKLARLDEKLAPARGRACAALD